MTGDRHNLLRLAGGLAFAALTATGAAAQTVYASDPLYGPGVYGPGYYGQGYYGSGYYGRGYYGSGYYAPGYYGQGLYDPAQTVYVRPAPTVETVQMIQPSRPAPVTREIVTTRRIGGRTVEVTTRILPAQPRITEQVVTSPSYTTPNYATRVYATPTYATPATYQNAGYTTAVVPVAGSVPGTAVWTTSAGQIAAPEEIVTAPVVTRAAAVSPVMAQQYYSAPGTTIPSTRGYRYVYLSDRILAVDSVTNAVLATYPR